MSASLYLKESNTEFYEIRYSQGYMDEWPLEKKQRVFEIIQQLNLPSTGKAIDFGCGNGVFTDVLQQALPIGWQVYGSDISQTAIKNAKKRFPKCQFFVSDLDNNIDEKFDFLFSHHVLEHVFDINKTIEEIVAFLEPKGSMLHILPCGNEGSFEYSVCSLRTDGINPNMENRYFFEDEGHVRRLTSNQATNLMENYGYELTDSWFSNQEKGAIKWVTQTHPLFSLKLTDSKKATGRAARRKLKALRYRLFALSLIQVPSRIQNKIRKKQLGIFVRSILCIINVIPFVFSKPIYDKVNRDAELEWEHSQKQKNGSEMFLFFSKL